MPSLYSVSNNERERKAAALPLSAPILVVEDDPDAVVVIRELISRAVAAPIDVANDSNEAMAYLERCLVQRDRLLPRLVLVDSNLAGSDGWQLVNWIQRNPDLTGLMIMVMSASAEPAAQPSGSPLRRRQDNRILAPEQLPRIRQAGYLSIAKDLKAMAFA